MRSWGAPNQSPMPAIDPATTASHSPAVLALEAYSTCTLTQLDPQKHIMNTTPCTRTVSECRPSNANLVPVMPVSNNVFTVNSDNEQLRSATPPPKKKKIPFGIQCSCALTMPFEEGVQLLQPLSATIKLLECFWAPSTSSTLLAQYPLLSFPHRFWPYFSSTRYQNVIAQFEV